MAVTFILTVLSFLLYLNGFSFTILHIHSSIAPIFSFFSYYSYYCKIQTTNFFI